MRLIQIAPAIVTATFRPSTFRPLDPLTMNFVDFSNLISNTADPVILIEGRRVISKELAESARITAAQLARKFPQLKFRSGNANGADEAFSAGVLEVDRTRLQIIAPYANHRKRYRNPDAHYQSPESLNPEELECVKELTQTASPATKGLMKCYEKGGKLGSQAACLIRDTMKVTGIIGKLPPPTAALFSIDPSYPDAGGTGHTIRVCRHAGVPVIFQDDWAGWAQSKY